MVKIIEIKPIVERLAVTIDGVRHYSEIDILKRYKVKIKNEYEVDYHGKVIFIVDVNTGEPHTCINFGKFRFETGAGFWKECFREQLPMIKKLCKRAVKEYAKPLRFQVKHQWN